MGNSETFVNQTVADNTVHLPNFNVIRKGKPNRGGGGLIVLLHTSEWLILRQIM